MEVSFMIPFYSYGSFTPFALTKFTNNWLCPNVCPVVSYLTFGKVGENPVVTPSANVQVIRASAPNRFLNTVTVKATTTPTP
jgi:hypothetical protein